MSAERIAALEAELAHTLERLSLTEERLQRALSAEAQAVAARSRFVANVNHELRTPLNAIIGYAELLTENDLSDAARRDVQHIRGAAEQLMQLVRDVLSLSELEAEADDIERVDVDLVPLLRRVVGPAMDQAESRHDTLLVDAPDALVHRTDPGRFSEIARNLVDNAIKFTEQGTILVVLRSSADAVELLVRDDGVGIAPERHQAIFEPFAHADPNTHDEHGGSGIGLTLTRGYVERLGGTIDVDSALGVGSTFRVRLPCS